MKWYEFDQNNSFGVHHADDKVCARLFIEAETEDKAIEIAISLGVYFNGCADGIDCSCCGDRWSEPYGDKTFPYKYTTGRSYKLFKTIEDYAQMLADEFGNWTTPASRIFYADGRVVEINASKID